MKLIFRMKRKMICLMIAQKTMPSQIIRVILLSASTKRLPKKLKNSKEDETMDEALQVLRKSNNQKQEDSFDIFGKHIANKIRSLDNANA